MNEKCRARQIPRRRAALTLLFMVVILASEPLVACPEETVDIGTRYVLRFEGRILPMDGDELLPGPIEFLVTPAGATDKEQRAVPVQPDGEFVLAVPPGTYRFRIKPEGFLFTLFGNVVVGDSERAQPRLTLRLPWC